GCEERHRESGAAADASPATHRVPLDLRRSLLARRPTGDCTPGPPGYLDGFGRLRGGTSGGLLESIRYGLACHASPWEAPCEPEGEQGERRDGEHQPLQRLELGVRVVGGDRRGLGFGGAGVEQRLVSLLGRDDRDPFGGRSRDLRLLVA